MTSRDPFAPAPSQGTAPGEAIAQGAGGRPAASYLVRFWLEPRDQEGDAEPYRGYVRDLRSGRELYFGDPRKFAEHVLRQLHSTRQEIAERSDPQELEDVI